MPNAKEAPEAGCHLATVCPELDVTQPAAAALGILSVEFAVHAWDFAWATGQQVIISDEVARHVLGVARQIITPEVRAGRRASSTT